MKLLETKTLDALERVGWKYQYTDCKECDNKIVERRAAKHDWPIRVRCYRCIASFFTNRRRLH